jgi:hypothetical protein
MLGERLHELAILDQVKTALSAVMLYTLESEHVDLDQDIHHARKPHGAYQFSSCHFLRCLAIPRYGYQSLVASKSSSTMFRSYKGKYSNVAKFKRKLMLYHPEQATKSLPDAPVWVISPARCP